MDDTPNLRLPYIMAAQAQKHVTHNEAIRALDAVVQIGVADRDLTAPPGSPAEGDRYIVAGGATGDWSGNDGHIAAWQDGAWMLYAPLEGWLAWVADEDVLVAWDGAGWVATGGGGGGSSTFTGLTDTPSAYAGAAGLVAAVKGDATGIEFADQLPLLGINATPDATNKLAVAAEASLFNHAGAGHQHKINKNAAGDTASILFQTGFSGRAEFGTTGDDDWHVKVSPDGSTWHEALVADKDTGAVSFAELSASAQAQTPLLVGGTGAGSTLTLKSTSGIGASDAIIGLVGNDGATEAFRADTDGNFLIGSGPPLDVYGGVAKLQMSDDNAANWGQIQAMFTSDELGTALAFVKSRSATIGTHAIVQEGDALGSIWFFGSDGSDYVPAASIDCNVSGTPGTDDMPGALSFWTTPDGSDTLALALTLNADQSTELAGNLKLGANAVVWDADEDSVTLASADDLLQTYLGGSILQTLTGSSLVVRHTASVAGVNALEPGIQNHRQSSAECTFAQYRWNNGGFGGSNWVMLSRNGTIGSHTIVHDGDTIGQFAFAASDGANFIRWRPSREWWTALRARTTCRAPSSST